MVESSTMMPTSTTNAMSLFSMTWLLIPFVLILSLFGVSQNFTQMIEISTFRSCYGENGDDLPTQKISLLGGGNITSTSTSTSTT
jgi:hypothetical protein